MHVFLTGNKQVGKSTAISKIIKAAGADADGFKTYWQSQSSNLRHLYIDAFIHVSGDMNHTPEAPRSRAFAGHLLAIDTGQGAMPVRDITQVFDIYASAILARSGKHGIIVMDELGTLESGATLFQNAVLQRINESVPVLGVLSIKRSPFLDSIRNHQNVKLIDVTAENRDEIVRQVVKHISVYERKV